MNDDKKVRLEEFIMGCMKLKGQAKSADIATLLHESRLMGKKMKLWMRKQEGQLSDLCYSMQGFSGGESPSLALSRRANLGGVAAQTISFDSNVAPILPRRRANEPR